MKKVVLIIFNILVVSQLILAQDNVLNGLQLTFKEGNAKEATRYLNDIVELSIDGEKGSYSKTQAEFILKDFFKNNPPTDFKKIHQGSSKEGLTYMIGKYIYPSGNYRVYIVVKVFKGNYLIDTIDFSKE